MKTLKFAALVATLALTSPALALTFPDRDGKAVVDDAHVLDFNTADALNRHLVRWEQKSHHQLVVATISDLQGQDINQYGVQLGREWKLGRTGVDDGVILLVAPKEHKVAISVGKGLEPILTDAKTKLILHDDVTPKLKEGNIGAALTAGAKDIAGTVDENEDEMIQPTPVSHTMSAPESHDHTVAIVLLSLLFGAFVLGVIALIAFRRKTIVNNYHTDHYTSTNNGGGYNGGPTYPSSSAYSGYDRYNSPPPGYQPGYYPQPQQGSNTGSFVEGAIAGVVGDELIRDIARDNRDDDERRRNDVSYDNSWNSTSNDTPSSSSSNDDSFSSNNSDSDSFSGGGSSDSWGSSSDSSGGGSDSSFDTNNGSSDSW